MENIITKIVLIVILFFVLRINLTAQEKNVIINNDSTMVKESAFLSDTTKFEMTQSAWGAVLRSAILPGFGQVYNKSYWKVPLIWGTLGYLIYQWSDRNKLYNNFRDLYEVSLTDAAGENKIYKDQRDFYRDQRDVLAVFIGLTYFLNMVDAFVDAHLFDLSLMNSGSNSTGIQLSLRVRM